MLLQRYTADFSAMIQHYQLNDEQLLYTGTPEMPIQISQTNPFIHPILGIENKQLTNFFVLDEKKDVALYTTNEQAILLRTFSTDKRYQGHGYAKAVLKALPDYIRSNFPDTNEIILAVNQKNIAAQTLYEKTGFERLEKIIQGEFGPLFVMNMKLEV
ncbi:GNAT family N-acetyltransferase [Enterococcus caccae]|uniref:N-acetyltransferase domain-containing protein n=1 Tax=Enterococcus caccae ATCC BAA-1240 TaxID=1158612 RepID=R3U1M1_9ENTE|nr:GNAT family N-acetyltransferase [Enterococcus caccae]EOL47804.1 hypothetical protein UC7_01054 [Enterococcus caccae ATCC BAA-1240]EOT65602.1 hypothetical protein I580_01358 [Enterococcus caccae ATCC BAA-1240]OJG27214.1 hypothetical protein RU98_GL002666 [Enterococcus caccae]